METWERDGHLEMEKRERDIRDEFKEVQYLFGVVAGRIEEVSGVADRAQEISGQMDQLQKMIQQILNNENSAAVAPNPDASSRSARERQMQKLELGNDAALGTKLGPRSHWFLRGRLPPSTGESVADLQALLADISQVKPDVVQQLRSLGGFDTLQFRPRME